MTLACVPETDAQGAAEYAKTASATTSAAQAKTVVAPSPPKLPQKPASAHLPLGLQPSQVEEENRRELLEKAGEQPAVILVRSDPSDAQVWIDGKPVGQTPLLLMVAAGAHVVELRGARMSHGRRGFVLAPKEKKEIVLSLKTRYPSQVQLH